MAATKQPLLYQRFRGFLPVIIDVETAGFNAQTDALLELAAIIVRYNDKGQLVAGDTFHYHITPFEGANIEQSALDFIGLDPYHPFRFAIDERDALSDLFQHIRKHIKAQRCQRAVLVGHNAHFDLDFLNAAHARCKLKRNPFHPFTCFDTASLSALTVGQTVLSKSVLSAGLEFNAEQAHSALYDAERTTALFCKIVNLWQDLGGDAYLVT